MGVVLNTRALRAAVWVETIISAEKRFLSPERSKANTSVGVFFRRYFWLSVRIILSLTKETLISPGLCARAGPKALMISEFILLGRMGIFFCRFIMVIFTLFAFRIGYAAVVYAA